MAAATVILDQKTIAHKLKRIAFQIYESNVREEEVIIAGIKQNGYLLAEQLKKEIEAISPLRVTLCQVKIDKKSPIDAVHTSIELDYFKDRSMVLVDDVLHSGTTLIYGVRHFLSVPLKRFKTAVLVDRNHKKYPVKADFKGISLSTSINENVDVRYQKGVWSAVLE